MRRFSLGAILVVGAAIRLLFLIINLEFTTLPQGGADALRFERDAWRLSQLGREGVSQLVVSGHGAITLLGSYIYDVTGRAPYVLGTVMLLLGLGVIYITYRAAMELWGDERMARLVAWGAALFPQLVLHSVLFLREIPVSFCLAAAALCAVRFVKRSNAMYVFWFSLWVVIGTLFHSGVIFAIPALLLGMSVTRPHENRGKVRYYAVNVVAAVVLVGAIYIVNSTGYGLNKFGGSLDTALEQFEQQELADTKGGAAFPEWMRVRGGLTDSWKLPIRYAAFLFSPMLPFMVRSLHHLLGVVDAVLYGYLLCNVYRNRNVIKKNRPAIVLLIVFVTLCIVYALGVSNFGTAIRHRAKMSPILLLIGAGLPYLQRVRYRARHTRVVASGQSISVST